MELFLYSAAGAIDVAVTAESQANARTTGLQKNSRG
jgi:hypothetical protein